MENTAKGPLFPALSLGLPEESSFFYLAPEKKVEWILDKKNN